MRRRSSLSRCSPSPGPRRLRNHQPVRQLRPVDRARSAKLATDAVQQLATLYAPARTRLELQQPTPGSVRPGVRQVVARQGLCPRWIPQPALPRRPRPRRHRRRGAPATTAASGGLPLRYVLDQAGDSNLYRLLTLMVGNQSITRPYLAQNGTFAPAGYWMRKGVTP